MPMISERYPNDIKNGLNYSYFSSYKLQVHMTLLAEIHSINLCDQGFDQLIAYLVLNYTDKPENIFKILVFLWEFMK